MNSGVLFGIVGLLIVAVLAWAGWWIFTFFFPKEERIALRRLSLGFVAGLVVTLILIIVSFESFAAPRLISAFSDRPATPVDKLNSLTMKANLVCSVIFLAMWSAFARSVFKRSRRGGMIISSILGLMGIYLVFFLVNLSQRLGELAH